MTSGYELKLYFEAKPYDGALQQYGIYQTGQVLFLRLEFYGKNRVLQTDFTPAELEAALEPFIYDPRNP